MSTLTVFALPFYFLSNFGTNQTTRSFDGEIFSRFRKFTNRTDIWQKCARPLPLFSASEPSGFKMRTPKLALNSSALSAKYRRNRFRNEHHKFFEWPFRVNSKPISY
jgi:hypothetical protein